MNKGQVVSVVTMAGEFVGKLNNTGGGAITLDDPRMLVYGEGGNMGFARGVCMTGEDNPDEITIQNYVFYTATNDDVVKAYRQATSGLIT